MRSNIESIIRLLGGKQRRRKRNGFCIHPHVYVLLDLGSIYAVNDDVTYLLLSAYENITSVSQSSVCKPNLIFTGSSGRPRYDIEQTVISMYINYGLSCNKIGEILGVSKLTLQRRVNQYGFYVVSVSVI